MTTADFDRDFDPGTLPKFLRRGPPGLQPSQEPEPAHRAVAVEPPAAEPEPPEAPLAVLEKHVRRIIEEDRRCHEANRNRLAEIASLVNSLTYGEMIELAEGFWKQKPEEKEIIQEMLPGMLHKWSTGR